jgi:hypothetical protein
MILRRLPRQRIVQRARRGERHNEGCPGAPELHIDREPAGWRIVSRCACRLVCHKGAHLFATLKDAEALMRAIGR